MRVLAQACSLCRVDIAVNWFIGLLVRAIGAYTYK